MRTETADSQVVATDVAPNAVLPDQAGRDVTLNGRRYSGKPLVLCFLAGAGIEARLAALAMRRKDFQDRGAEICAVTSLTIAENEALGRRLGVEFDILADAGGRLRTVYVGSGDPSASLSFVVSRSFRVRHVETATDPAAHVAALIAILDRLSRAEPAPAPAARHAPVLLVPEVLEPEFCVELQELGERHFKPGLFTRKVGDTSQRFYDDSIKRRLDYDIAEAPVLERINRAMSRRLLPEIQKAFGFQVRKAEHFRIGCYDSGDAGYFTAHRDNVSPGTKYRKFAMSLNLNTGAYEGGNLQFPEYGPGLYAPAAGEAVVFSCSLLHQALPVTKGRRFVLLSFFA